MYEKQKRDGIGAGAYHEKVAVIGVYLSRFLF